jgi:hypothetical protein
MADMSNYLENELLDHSLGVGSYTMPGTVYGALYITDPTDADTGTEVTGGGYARQAITFGAASGGSASPTGTVDFGTASADWGTVSHFGIRDASSSGNLLYHDALASSKIVENGDSFSIPAANLTVSLT